MKDRTAATMLPSSLKAGTMIETGLKTSRSNRSRNSVSEVWRDSRMTARSPMNANPA